MKRLYSFLVLLIFVPLYISAQVGFNKVGYINATVDTSQTYLGIALDSQHRIVIAGRTQVIGDEDLNALLIRYNPDGSLDKSFNAGSVNGGPGYVNRTGAMGSWGYYGLVINSQGDILAVGTAKNLMNQDVGLIACYKPNGTLNTSFNAGSIDGGPGFINDKQTVATDSSTYYAVALDSQDRIIAVGENAAGQGLIVRYNSNGTNESIFNQGNTNSEVYYAVTLDHNGRIIAVGNTPNPKHGLIACYKADGTLDTTFNAGSINGGLGYINLEGDTNSYAYYSVAIDSQNRIIVVGTTDLTDGLIVRYNSNGTLDTSFNQSGINGGPGYINLEGPTNSWSFNAVSCDSNNKIVIVGSTNGASPYDLVMRLNQDGTFDTTFNGTGYNTTEDSIDCWEYYAVKIDNNGRLFVTGRSGTNPPTNPPALGHGILARYLPNGLLDTESNWNAQNFREIAKINNTPIGMMSS
ncbi:MAG: hypothetical protein EBU90_24010 [Proteobacteria bacterium]|nr:hypothetical protein [Pseudomonadota bacterium]NBP16320.1 hypothetical protein [bacterium]